MSLQGGLTTAFASPAAQAPATTTTIPATGLTIANVQAARELLYELGYFLVLIVSQLILVKD